MTKNKEGLMYFAKKHDAERALQAIKTASSSWHTRYMGFMFSVDDRREAEPERSAMTINRGLGVTEDCIWGLYVFATNKERRQAGYWFAEGVLSCLEIEAITGRSVGAQAEHELLTDASDNAFKRHVAEEKVKVDEWIAQNS